MREEVGLGTKAEGEATIMEEGPAATVRLISAEGFEFIIDYEAACVSNTIKNMLSSKGTFTETELGEIRFPEITAPILEKVCQYFYYKLRYTNRYVQLSCACGASPPRTIPRAHRLPHAKTDIATSLPPSQHARHSALRHRARVRLGASDGVQLLGHVKEHAHALATNGERGMRERL